LASEFRDRQPIIESAIHGSSMAPAVPPGARLRVRLLGQQPCEPGDVAYYWSNDGYTVHRVVYRARRDKDRDYLLTCGDNRLAPDPPVPSDRLLGTVIAVETPDGWRPPGPAIVAGPFYRRAIHRLTVATMIAVLWVSPAAAARLGIILLTLEAYGRARVARFRQRLHHDTAEY